MIRDTWKVFLWKSPFILGVVVGFALKFIIDTGIVTLNLPTNFPF